MCVLIYTYIFGFIIRCILIMFLEIIYIFVIYINIYYFMFFGIIIVDDEKEGWMKLNLWDLINLEMLLIF